MRKLAITFLTIVFCLTSSIAFSETLKHSDLVERNGIAYKKFTSEPYSGSVEGRDKYGRWGHFFKTTYKNGKIVVEEWYFDNGKLHKKGTYKNGKRDGVWELYHQNGQLWKKETYKNGNIINFEKF